MIYVLFILSISTLKYTHQCSRIQLKTRKQYPLYAEAVLFLSFKSCKQISSSLPFPASEQSVHITAPITNLQTKAKIHTKQIFGQKCILHTNSIPTKCLSQLLTQDYFFFPPLPMQLFHFNIDSKFSREYIKIKQWERKEGGDRNRKDRMNLT